MSCHRRPAHLDSTGIAGERAFFEKQNVRTEEGGEVLAVAQRYAELALATPRHAAAK